MFKALRKKMFKSPPTPIVNKTLIVKKTLNVNKTLSLMQEFKSLNLGLLNKDFVRKQITHSYKNLSNSEQTEFNGMLTTALKESKLMNVKYEEQRAIQRRRQANRNKEQANREAYEAGML